MKGIDIMSYGFTNAKSIINNNGQITIPEPMLKKLGFEKGDVLRLTATETLIVIEKCEDEEDEY
jgi:bifunctional DNA-binding transcriptional regulator/antitoxin component of YhaV-PrlF toxin-antitoxin module